MIVGSAVTTRVPDWTGWSVKENRVMLRNLADLRNYRIHAIDGEIGAVQDVWFVDRHWTIRYFVVGPASWTGGDKVLISPTAVGRADWVSRQLRVMLARDQVKDAPGVDANLPLSRREEEQLVGYYAWLAYWATPASGAAAAESAQKPPEAAAAVESSRDATGHHEPLLRSVREVTGYRIHVHDGSIGHVEGFIGDNGDWVIRYLVADTRGWLPDKRVLLSPTWIKEVDWARAQIRMDFARKQIEHAPPYDPATPINRDYEGRLHHYYGRPAYWTTT
jgi:hypothetical protein